MKKFSITFVAKVDEDNNFLSSFEDAHEEDMHDVIINAMHDVDDIEIENLVGKERG